MTRPLAYVALAALALAHVCREACRHAVRRAIVAYDAAGEHLRAFAARSSLPADPEPEQTVSDQLQARLAARDDRARRDADVMRLLASQCAMQAEQLALLRARKAELARMEAEEQALRADAEIARALQVLAWWRGLTRPISYTPSTSPRNN